MFPDIDRPGSRDLAQFRRLWRFVAPYRLRLAGAALALVAAAGAVLALGQGLRHVVDAGFASGDRAILDHALAMVIALAVLLAAATWARFYLMMTTGERVVADLRRAVYDHVLTLSPSWFDAMRTAEVISRLGNDTTLLQAVLGYGFSMAVRNALLLAGALGLLVATDLKLALLVILGAPLVLAPVLLLGRRVRRSSRASQDRVADMSVYADETLHEIRTVQALVHEDTARREFGARVEAVHDAGVRRIAGKAALIGLVMLFAFGGVACVLWVGGRDVLAGRITPGELAAFVFYCAVAAGAVGAIAEVMGELQRAAGATERLLELLAMSPDIAAAPGAAAVPAARRGFAFEGVRFAYPSRPATPALEGFDLAVAAGERVALVGPSGAGKSTVLALLLRFYDPQAGALRIDGVDLRALEPRALRRLIAVVPQEPVVFAASVHDNIAMGRPGATRAEVERACREAFAMEFVERLPQGLDTPVGERGVTLSGGQRQRLSIARALLADRPILLLDEATSSLDAASERMVQQGLERLERGRTVLVIAHRLATVRHADRIVVIDRGRVVEAGTHEALLAGGGLYARLAALQFLRDGPVPAVAVRAA